MTKIDSKIKQQIEDFVKDKEIGDADNLHKRFNEMEYWGDFGIDANDAFNYAAEYLEN